MEEELAPIIAWLEAGEAADYQAGVLLLQARCRNRSLVNTLLKKESAANREKLVYELLKLGANGDLAQVSEVQNLYAQTVRGAAPAPAAPVVAPLPEPPAPEPEQVPDAVRAEVDELTQLMSRLHSERCQLSNRLADGGPSEPELVRQILSLQDQYNALAQKRRNLVEGGQPAEQPSAPAEAAPAGEQAAPEGEPTAAPAIDRAALQQQRGNLRSNISKTKGKLEKAQTEEKKSELAQKLAKYEVELTDVELKLKAPQA